MAPWRKMVCGEVGVPRWASPLERVLSEGCPAVKKLEPTRKMRLGKTESSKALQPLVAIRGHITCMGKSKQAWSQQGSRVWKPDLDKNLCVLHVQGGSHCILRFEIRLRVRMNWQETEMLWENDLLCKHEPDWVEFESV